MNDLLLSQKIDSAQDKSPLQPGEELLINWPPDTVALEYFLGADRGWVFLIDRSGHVTAHTLVDEDGNTLAPRQLIADVYRLQDHMNLQARKMLTQRRFDHTWQTPLHRLFRQLMPAPVFERLGEAKTVVIVPHHILHYLPFAALVVEPDVVQRGRFEVPMARFLIDEPFAICSSPSLSTWRRLREDTAPINQVTAVGIVDFSGASSLPGVEEDIRNLRRCFGEQVQEIAEGPEATETRTVALMARPGMLFLATHGQNIPDQPLTSYLLCQGDDQQDGQLTATEIYDRHVAADLIVMSALLFRPG